MNASHPLVSVILPVHNHQAYVGSALDSVFSQTYPRLELVVLDDGSRDQSVQEVRNKIRHAPFPCHLILQENRGAHAALNRGINLSTGVYISLLNSDDCYHPERIRRMVLALQNSPKRFAFSKVEHVDELGKPLKVNSPHRHYYEKSLRAVNAFPTPSFELIRPNFAVSSGNFLFYRDLFQEIGDFQPYETCHDWDYLLRLIRVEEPLFMDQVLYYYRVHSGNTLARRADLRAAESGEAFLGYLHRMDRTKNELAPCPENWQSYWTCFTAGCFNHFGAELLSAGLSTGRGSGRFLNARERWLFGRGGKLLNGYLNFKAQLGSWSRQERIHLKKAAFRRFGSIFDKLVLKSREN